MNRLFPCICFILLLGMAQPADGALGIYGAWWNGDDTDDSAGFGAKIDIIDLGLLSIDGRVSWLSSDHTNLVPLEVTGLANITMFYGGVGFGYYIFNGKDELSFDNSPGVYLLGGAKASFTAIGVFAELKYTWLDTKLADIGDVSASGVGINVGVSLGL